MLSVWLTCIAREVQSNEKICAILYLNTPEPLYWLTKAIKSTRKYTLKTKLGTPISVDPCVKWARDRVRRSRGVANVGYRATVVGGGGCCARMNAAAHRTDVPPHRAAPRGMHANRYPPPLYRTLCCTNLLLSERCSLHLMTHFDC